MFEIEKVDMEHIDRIRPLWEKLIQANAANSPYFADYYGTFEFEIRKGFLQEKLDNGAAMYTAVLVDREKKQDAGFVTVTYNGYFLRRDRNALPAGGVPGPGHGEEAVQDGSFLSGHQLHPGPETLCDLWQ